VDPANRRLIRPSLTEIKEQRTTPPPRKDGPVLKKTTPPDQTNAENFYYLKQMQSKTLMTIVLKDGEQVQGVIEWYDRHCIRVARTGGASLLIYKPAIRYIYKVGEATQS